MNTSSPLIRVGISSCLLGQEVRYDGSHKLSTLCTRELGRYFEFVPTCPEAGAGLGIPRPPIRLVGDPDAPRAVRVEDSRIDVTASLQAYGRERLPQLQDLCGYIFISKSPSCGLHSVKVYAHDGRLGMERGRGIFARQLTQALPLLPVEEDSRLQDPVLRENFITRVFAWHNWRQLCAGGLTLAGISGFHSRYELVLMACHPPAFQGLGDMLVHAGNADPAELGARYFSALLRALQHKAVRRTNTTVLAHLLSQLERHLSPAEKQRLADSIDEYRKGRLPLAVSAALLKQKIYRHDPALEQQAWLQPWSLDRH